MPCERYNSIRYTEKFLLDLCDPKKTPRVPKAIREQAYRCLRHYPGEFYLDMIATKCPEVLETSNPVNELSILVHDYEQSKNNVSKNQ
jgi:hypothetical protein